MDSNVSDKERSIALDFCNKFLSGAWKNVSLEKISVTAVRNLSNKTSGGMTNLLYRCALADDARSSDGEPNQVLLRIYGPSTCNIPVQLSIFERLAEAKLGPVLLSTFDRGRFEEYLPSSPLTSSQITDDSISRVVAEKIAAIHRLDIDELDKTPNWLIDNLNRINTGLSNILTLSGDGVELSEETLQSTRDIAHQMLAIDLKQEIVYLDRLLRESKIPLVFSHNDLHQNNIILLHDSNLSLSDRVVLIDFEYCSYNYLAFDLANHLSEWCFDYTGDDYPNFNFSLAKFPSEDKQRQFISYYVNGMDIDFKQELFDPSLSDVDIVELLMRELKPFLMASNLLWSMWAIQSSLTSKIKFGYWEMSKCKWDVYELCKRSLEETK